MSYVGATPGTGWYFLAEEEGAQPERVVCFALDSNGVPSPVIRDPEGRLFTKTVNATFGIAGRLIHESEL
ncbi:hypothetical protein [Streptomyces sp. NPDC091299]|uniref:hypothetical protein n=1 Tax=Streptomyces sp. NPDC091299 TaxID=3155302 RepID=UPI00344AEEB4